MGAAEILRALPLKTGWNSAPLVKFSNTDPESQWTDVKCKMYKLLKGLYSSINQRRRQQKCRLVHDFFMSKPQEVVISFLVFMYTSPYIWLFNQHGYLFILLIIQVEKSHVRQHYPCRKVLFPPSGHLNSKQLDLWGHLIVWWPSSQASTYVLVSGPQLFNIQHPIRNYLAWLGVTTSQGSYENNNAPERIT